MTENDTASGGTPSFFERPQVNVEMLPYGQGIPLGIERVFNSQVGLGGAYGAWGESYDNQSLPRLVEERLGGSLPPDEKLSLSELGFDHRHHLSKLNELENFELEVEVGVRYLREAAAINGWETSEVQGVLVGVSGPVSNDYTDLIARKAGIPESAIKVSVHKACDGAVGSLHLALNPDLPQQKYLPFNIANTLYGKKVLVGGIEGLSRFMWSSHDTNALQLFGNGAAVIGVIPGQTMKFLVGRTHEVYDDEGVLQVKMCYPHSGHPTQEGSNIEVSQVGENSFRLAGLMHQPADGSPVEMAGPMGMVKLFVRTGVEVVRDVYQNYQKRMGELGLPGKSMATAVVHHANYKINQLKEKHLAREGIHIPMPWVLSDFGNVSAASTMIAFLRQLSSFKPGDHILIDGFGAGTYYDAMAVEMGG